MKKLIAASVTLFTLTVSQTSFANCSITEDLDDKKYKYECEMEYEGESLQYRAKCHCAKAAKRYKQSSSGPIYDMIGKKCARAKIRKSPKNGWKNFYVDTYKKGKFKNTRIVAVKKCK